MISIGRQRRRRIDVADSGALSDLAFLLIIFFIVIAVFTTNRGFLLGLPERDSQRLVAAAELARVTIGAGGEYALAGEPVDATALAAEVRSLRRAAPNMTLMVRVHPEAPYQAVVDVIRLAREEDIDNFSLGLQDGR